MSAEPPPSTLPSQSAFFVPTLSPRPLLDLGSSRHPHRAVCTTEDGHFPLPTEACLGSHSSASGLCVFHRIYTLPQHTRGYVGCVRAAWLCNESLQTSNFDPQCVQHPVPHCITSLPLLSLPIPPLALWAHFQGRPLRTLGGVNVGHAHWVNTMALNTDYALRTGAYDHSGTAPPTRAEGATLGDGLCGWVWWVRVEGRQWARG